MVLSGQVLCCEWDHCWCGVGCAVTPMTPWWGVWAAVVRRELTTGEIWRRKSAEHSRGTDALHQNVLTQDLKRRARGHSSPANSLILSFWIETC